MEERDGQRSCRDRLDCPAVRMKQQVCADRLTPAQPHKGSLSISMMLMRRPAPTDTQRQLCPGDGRSVLPLNPHHPTGAKRRKQERAGRSKKCSPERRWINVNTKSNEDMQLAIGNYTGPIAKCHPGRARAPAKAAAAKKIASVECYAKPIKDQKAMRKQMRILRAQQSRIAERNAAIKKRLGER
jgi:hypothetical protein